MDIPPALFGAILQQLKIKKSAEFLFSKMLISLPSQGSGLENIRAFLFI